MACWKMDHLSMIFLLNSIKISIHRGFSIAMFDYKRACSMIYIYMYLHVYIYILICICIQNQVWRNSHDFADLAELGQLCFCFFRCCLVDISIAWARSNFVKSHIQDMQGVFRGGSPKKSDWQDICEKMGDTDIQINLI